MRTIKDFFEGFGLGMKLFGSNITTIINTILLTIAYIIGVGITAIPAKVFRKKFIEMNLLDKKGTYWSDLKLKKKPMEEYYRQF